MPSSSNPNSNDAETARIERLTREKIAKDDGTTKEFTSKALGTFAGLLVTAVIGVLAIHHLFGAEHLIKRGLIAVGTLFSFWLTWSWRYDLWKMWSNDR